MLTQEFMRRMAAKHRAEKETEGQPEENLHAERSYQPPPRSPQPKKRTTSEGKEAQSRASGSLLCVSAHTRYVEPAFSRGGRGSRQSRRRQ
jgi:hypothetical protein